LGHLKSGENTIFITGSFVYTGSGVWSMSVIAKCPHSLNGGDISDLPCISPC
jgi:hypothetical protein